MVLENKINLRLLYLIIFLVLTKFFFGFYLINTNSDFFFTSDSKRYIEAAIEICKTGKFNDVNGVPEIIRTPGTSFFLLPAICFGIDLKNYIIFLNLAMILLSAFFTFKLIRLIEIKIHYSIVFLFFLLDPTIMRYQYNILSEIIFLFWFTLLLYFLVLGLKYNNFYYFFFGFVIITAGTFVKPIILYLPYYLLGCLIILYSLSYSFRQKFKYPLLITAILGVFLHYSFTQYWTDRNYKLTGIKEFTYIKTINSYYYLTAGILAKSQKKNFIDVQKEFLVKTQNFSQKQLLSHSKTQFKKALLDHPFDAVLVGLEGAMMTFFTPGTGQYAKMLNINAKNYETSKLIFNFLGITWVVLMFFLFIIGIIKIKKNFLIAFLIIVFIYLLLVSSGPMSYSRFRIPFIPIIVIFISYGFENLLKMIKNSKL